MSFFGVTIERIRELKPIEGADRIETAKLEGNTFEFVVPKGKYNINDKVLYFPIDSVLPLNTQEKLGLVGKLAGKNKDRVKTIKLRGQISQGVVAPVDLIIGTLIPDKDWDIDSEEITKFFGVVKYEPPEILSKDCTLVELPAGLSVYDIEGADRYPNIINMLMNQNVLITEKIEGSNFSVTSSIDDIFVNQRKFSIKEKDGVEHTWWKVARNKHLIDLAKSLRERFSANSATIYGEMIGPSIQGNIYKLNEHKVMIFDIKIDNNYLPVKEYLEVTNGYDIAPVIWDGILKDFLDGCSIVEKSHGESKLFKTLREGIVIKPHNETYECNFGRIIIKQRDPIYLSKNDN